MAISDTLFEAVAEIRDYLTTRPHMYAHCRPQLEKLLTDMEALRMLLDRPPGGRQ